MFNKPADETIGNRDLSPSLKMFMAASEAERVYNEKESFKRRSESLAAQNLDLRRRLNLESQ